MLLNAGWNTVQETYTDTLVSGSTSAETVKTYILTKQIPAVEDNQVQYGLAADGPIRNINL